MRGVRDARSRLLVRVPGRERVMRVLFPLAAVALLVSAAAALPVVAADDPVSNAVGDVMSVVICSMLGADQALKNALGSSPIDPTVQLLAYELGPTGPVGGKVYEISQTAGAVYGIAYGVAIGAMITA